MKKIHIYHYIHQENEADINDMVCNGYHTCGYP